MSANAVIDIAIALILMYLLLSLICTTINELIATAFSLRSRTLATSIEKLLDDPALKVAFYDHGLIDGAMSASGTHPSYLSGRSFALALLGSLDPTKPLPGFDDLRDSIQHLPDSNVRDMLLAHLMTADGDLSTLRDGVAAWFDQAMDRVTGIYKRYLKWLSLGVAVVLVTLVNADSIVVANTLWNDGTLRAEMVQTAQTVVAAQNDGQPEQRLEQLKIDQAELRPFPLGWDFPAPPCPTCNFSPGHLLARLLGLLISAFAVSLGAPFWFDLLQKFMNIRGAGAPPQRTATEG